MHSPLNLSESCGARYLLIWDDGRISRGYLERRQLEVDPAAAVAYARAAAYEDADAAWVLGPTTMPEVELHDPGSAAIAAGETSTLTRRLARVRQQAAAQGLRTWSGSFSASESESRLLTSAGLEAAGRGTTFGWYVTADGEIGDGYAARKPEDEPAFEDRLRRLLEYVARLAEPPASMQSGTRPIILHPRVVEEFVIGTLLHNLEGGRFAHGEVISGASFSGPHRVARRLACASIRPAVPQRGPIGSRPKGASRAVSLHRRGRLVQPIVDLKYARRRAWTRPLPYGNDTIFSRGLRVCPQDAWDAARGGRWSLPLGVQHQDSGSR